jgi:hypothetical protein
VPGTNHNLLRKRSQQVKPHGFWRRQSLSQSPCLPFGYRIEDGKAVVDDKAAEQVKELFLGYLSGLSLKNAAIKAGIDCYHATVSRMLQNKQYLGDEFYPSIIDEEIFEKAKPIF